jgi:glucose-1-phosphate cytidylyltransferase
VKEWFSDYFLHNSDFTLDLKDNTITYHKTADEKWRITFIETGHLTMTGGRIKRIKDYVGNETFMMTYGDGVANINVKELVDFHKKHKKLATITSVFPEGRFGTIFIDDHSSVTSFSEKTDNKNRVNGGFFVLEPKVFDYILDGDETIFEKGPLEKLARDGQLKAFHHDGFWKPMDTLNDKNKLEDMWAKGAPWKIWE